MLSEKISYLLKLLGTGNKQISNYAGCSPTNFSRLKSGSRAPDKNSPTIRKLCDGVYGFAKDTESLSRLRVLTGCIDGSEQELKEALANWLFDEKPVKFSDLYTHDVTDMVGKKISSLMELTGVSGSKLSRELNIDPSYISRLRSGERILKNNSAIMDMICEKLSLRAIAVGKASELKALMELPEDFSIEEDTPAIVKKWLYAHDKTENITVVKKIIQSIEDYPDQIQEIPPMNSDDIPEEVLNDDAPDYVGTSGLRKAVMRFLGNAAKNQCRELKLYSDQGLSWLNGEFGYKWHALMNSCLKEGIPIKIIHNIERDSEEMLMAIGKWLPLYMSGVIEPYYCTKKNGDRFKHTLFLAPENACITGCCVAGHEDGAYYTYVTSPERLAFLENEFDDLLSVSRPLVKMKKGTSSPSGESSVYTYSKVQICVCDSYVIVNKLSAPATSFTFSHPMLCRAFKIFVQTLKPEFD